MKYRYMMSLKWHDYESEREIKMCSECTKWGVVIGSGTICKITGKNIGASHFYKVKPSDCPLKEVRNA